MAKPKPGRRTAADLSVIPLSPGARRLQPPADLDPDAAQVFREIVNACPESHFVASDQQLLATYATAPGGACDMGKSVAFDRAVMRQIEAVPIEPIRREDRGAPQWRLQAELLRSGPHR
jgi:hypothetical protein